MDDHRHDARSPFPIEDAVRAITTRLSVSEPR